MDGKYAKYIRSPYGFICDYDVQDGKVVIYTAKSKKREPHTYTANKENIGFSETRLEKQYQLLREHKDEIKKDICKTVRGVMYRLVAGSILGTGLLFAILTTLNITTIGAAIMLFLELLSIPVGEISLATWKAKFDEAIEAQEMYMSERANIESKSQQDENITQYLSQHTLNILEENKKLQQEGKIDQVFNINLMDKSSLKDLKTLLERYQISMNLGTAPEYHAPEVTSKPKKKMRIKEENE